MLNFFNKKSNHDLYKTLTDKLDFNYCDNIKKITVKDNCTIDDYYSFLRIYINNTELKNYDIFPTLNDDLEISRMNTYFIKDNDKYFTIFDDSKNISVTMKRDCDNFKETDVVYFDTINKMYGVNSFQKNNCSKKSHLIQSFYKGQTTNVDRINDANYTINDVLINLSEVPNISDYFDINRIKNIFNNISLNTYHPVISNDKLSLSLSIDNFTSSYFNKKNVIKFDIVLNNNKRKIGEICFDYMLSDKMCYSGNISYFIKKQYRSNGYATDSLSLLKKFLKSKYFSENKNLFLAIKPGNKASIRVAEKNGADLIYDGFVPESEPMNYIDGAKKIKIYEIKLN